MEQQSTYTIAVVGLGKIGLPLVGQFTSRGQRVIGCDINPAVVDAVNAGRSPVLEEPELQEKIADAKRRDLLSATPFHRRGVRIPVKAENRRERRVSEVEEQRLLDACKLLNEPIRATARLTWDEVREINEDLRILAELDAGKVKPLFPRIG